MTQPQIDSKNIVLTKSSGDQQSIRAKWQS
jgi:hypothetical protein